jgi:hypothetical protein
MTVIAMQRTKNGVFTSADSATLSIVNSAGVIVLPTTTVLPASAGNYSYATTALLPGSYTATWVFTTAGLPTDTISRAFTIDPAQEVVEGVMLMQIERLAARRMGPYRRIKVAAGSTVNSVLALRLKSSRDIGSYEDQYMLRRGLRYGEDLVTNFNPDDRIRNVDSFTSITGSLVPDRSYTLAPVADEAVELHALDPEEELRAAVLDGLTRCFFWDTVQISVTDSGVYDINLSASVPWLTQVNQVKDVTLAYPSQLLPPTRLKWWKAYRQGKDLRLYTKGGMQGAISVQVLRPASSLVNGETSLAGPNDDLDVLYVDPDYAAWAAVLEAWKTIPEVLQPLATQNMRPSRADAAAEFTKKSLTIVQQVPEFLQIDYGVTELVQIGNLAEPVT